MAVWRRADIGSRRPSASVRHVAPGAERVIEVNGWTVTIQPSRRRLDRAAPTVQRGPRVMHLELNKSQMTAFDPDAFWYRGG